MGGPSPIDLGWPETTQDEEEVGKPPPIDVDRPKASPEEQKPETPTPTDLKNPEAPAKKEGIRRPLPTDLNEPKAVPEEQTVKNPPANDFTGQETAPEEKEVEKEKPSDFTIPETVPETQKAERLPQNDQIVVTTDKKYKYTGTPVTLDFQNAPITSVLKFMAEINDYNIIIDPQVTKTITIALHKAVPWDHAMDIIMRTCRLSMKIEGKIIRVGPMATFDQEIAIIPINYAAADASLIKKLAPLLSKAKGVLEPPSLIIDPRTNSLIIKDVPEKIARIKEVLAELDKETPQVMIQIRIVEATKAYSKELGVRWGGRYNRTINYTFPRTINATGIRGTPYAVNLPNQGDIFGGIELRLGHINGLTQLNLSLEAMEHDGKGKIISNPRIATMDNEEAIIISGTQIPYPTTDKEGNPTVQFIDASIKLVVTPHITPDNSIIIKIVANKNEPDWGHLVNGRPAINMRQAQTKLIVQNEDTAVIGGLYVHGEQKNVRQVPWLSKIPLIGLFFKARSSNEMHDELLIFITPSIMNKSFSPNKLVLKEEGKKIQVKKKKKNNFKRIVKKIKK